MHRVYGGAVFSHFAQIVKQIPPLTRVLPPDTYTPVLKMLHTSDEESYLLSIEYGPYGLSCLAFLTDPFNRVFFDLPSTVMLISLGVENSITEYDMSREMHEHIKEGYQENE